MAVPGPAPKPERSRPNDTARRQAEMRHVAADGELRGFELPDDVLPEDTEWHPLTRAWWQSWRCSAQAQEFGGTDWSQLLDCAALHHLMWQHGRLELAGEIRLRAGKFGQTPTDRLRLRIAVEGEEH